MVGEFVNMFGVVVEVWEYFEVWGIVCKLIEIFSMCLWVYVV